MARVEAETPTREELLARASALVPVLRKRAERTEQQRQVLTETVDDLHASQLTRLGVPRRFGGLDVDYDVMLEVAIELARGCPATSWCYSLWCAHAWMIGHWPLAAQEEVFEAGPQVLCSSSLSPAGGTIEPVSGGFRLSGRWEFSSGCDNADWLMLGATGREGPVLALVPRGEFEIIDTWFVAGLRGTGSKDVSIEGGFLPQRRVLPGSVRSGLPPGDAWELHRQPQYRVPMSALLGWDLVAPAVGMACGAIDEFSRRMAGTSGRARSAESPLVQTRLAESAAEADAARALLCQDVRELLARGARGEAFSALDLARYPRDKAFVIRLAVQSVSRLFEIAGGHALFDSDPLQRFQRDVMAAAHRDGVVFDFAGQQYGKLALEAPGPTTGSG